MDARGSGAFMRVHNSTAVTITIWITNVHCMYDHGEEGSNLHIFNGAEIPPGEWYPGHRQYIEANGSGGCWFTPSSFNLGWAGREATIEVSSGNWGHRDVPGIAIEIEDGEQANIHAWFYEPDSAEGAKFEKPAP